MKSILSISAALLIASSLQAQETDKQWTLEECIDYAIEHNIDLKQKQVSRENSKVELNTSKYSWLPDLNAGVGQNFDFGRSPTKDGVIVDQNSSSSSASIQPTPGKVQARSGQTASTAATFL